MGFHQSVLSVRLSALLFCAFTGAALPAEICRAENFTHEGGDATGPQAGTLAFQQLPSALTDAERKEHEKGDAAFGVDFSKPNAQGNIAIGPRYNNVSCNACHVNDGRGLSTFGKDGSDMLVRVSLPTGIPAVPNGPVPVPGIGGQLQDHAVKGSHTGASIKLAWRLIEGTYTDGEKYTLRKPKLTITMFNGSKLRRPAMSSIRRTPPVFGLGLLEAVPEQTILDLAADQETKGIVHGHANRVYDVLSRGESLGRFGLKAGQPSLLQQSAGAYANDMGISNPLFPAADGSTEISNATLQAAAFYSKTLAVPQQRNSGNSHVAAGQKIFVQIGCDNCHVTTVKTGDSNVAAIAHQTIHPFTDMLLHDMGEGLADHRPEFYASGTEWRTAPLWGIGLTGTALGTGEGNYLHDGRARNFAEAIIWHDGEARASQQDFLGLSKQKRADLIAFLASL